MKQRMIGYATVFYDTGSQQWRMLGIGRLRATRLASEIDTARWSEHGYEARTVEVWFPRVGRRWNLRDVWNQVCVWASWVRS